MRNLAPHESGGGHTSSAQSSQHSGHQMSGNMTQEMRMMNDKMEQHLGQQDPEYEKRFIDMMVVHHQGAIQMSRNALQNANRPELKAMAKKAIEDQQKEIEQLQTWREQWYGRNAQ